MSSSAISKLLARSRAGDAAAHEDLFNRVYEELRALARRRLRGFPEQSLGATDLVHEMYERVVRRDQLDCENRRHFFGVTARAMQDILVERVRRKNARKHGGQLRRVEVADALSAAEAFPEEFLSLEAAISRLSEVDLEAAEVVRLKFLVGLSHEEMAEVTGVSVRTIDRRWQYAKAWLHHELYGGDS